MSWVYLLIAGVFESVWVTASSYLSKEIKLWAVILMVVGYSLSMLFLIKSLKTIPVSIAYTIWTALGVLNIVLYSHFFLQEKLNIMQLLCLLLVVIGVLGLKFLS